MASETEDPIDWSHPPPSWAVPPERLVHSINHCTSVCCMAMSVVWQCLLYGNVCCMAMSVVWQCRLYGNVCCMALSVVWLCPLYGKLRCMVSSVAWQCPLRIQRNLYSRKYMHDDPYQKLVTETFRIIILNPLIFSLAKNVMRTRTLFPVLC